MNPVYRQLLLQVMRDRASSGVLVRLSWFVGACALAALLFAYYIDKPLFGEVLMLFLTCGLAYLWCGAFVKNAVRQNMPSNAVLVPGLRRHLMRLTAWLYLSATLLAGLLSWILVERPGYGLLGGALFSIYVLYAQRFGLLNFLPTVAIVGSLSVSKHPLDALLAAADRIGEPVVTLVGLALLALVSRHAVRSLFPHGGDRHWLWYQCHRRQLARASGEALNMEPGSGFRWLAWLRLPYNAGLRADSRRGAAHGRQMMHALGTMAHDGGAIAYVLISVVSMSWAGRYLGSHSDPAFLLVSSTMMQGMLMMSVLVYAATVSSQAVRFSGEQSLYRLTPAAPAATRFNRVLLGALMFRCLRLWALSLAAIICIDMVVMGRFEVRGITVALGALMLPFAGLLLRDYAAVPRQPNATLTVAASIAVVVAYIALAVVDQMRPGLPLFWFSAAVAAMTGVALRLRWQQLAAAPVAFPAGRLAA